jgi:Lar family restriction alleviation protein
MTPITQQIEEYKALRREIFALYEEAYQDRKLELVPKRETIETLIYSQLLPCPMCGGSNIKIYDKGHSPCPLHTNNVVACEDCGLTMPVYSEAELSIERAFEAMNKWNKRHK